MTAFLSNFDKTEPVTENFDEFSPINRPKTGQLLGAALTGNDHSEFFLSLLSENR